MILKNAKIFDEKFNIVQSDISVKGQKIDEIAPALQGNDSFDLSNCIIAPGFVDIHIHGCAGADTCDGTREAVAKMAEQLITKGVTSFCPTTMTVSNLLPAFAVPPAPYLFLHSSVPQGISEAAHRD